jgi:hypothetical protein
MKRHHKIKLGDTELRLSLSFKTSLTIMDEIASPTKIVESILRGYQAEKLGQEYDGEFVFNERNSVRIMEIGNAEFEGKSFDEIGELAMEGNFLHFYGEVLGYLNEMVLGRSQETSDVEVEQKPGEQPGQSS